MADMKSGVSQMMNLLMTMTMFSVTVVLCLVGLSSVCVIVEVTLILALEFFARFRTRISK